MQEIYDESEKIKADVTVLIVEDEDVQRESISRQLKADQNFSDFKIVEVMEAANSQNAEAAINSAAPNLVLLDCHLKNSELQGEELCEKLRSEGFSRPIIMLTAVNIEPEDEGSSLRKGANDYLRKPFNMGVLMERINKQLVLYEKSEDAEFRIGEFLFKPAKNWLDHPAKGRTPLTAMETGILKFLYKARGQVVAKPVLLKRVWNYSPKVTTHTLETHIYRLRQKIEVDPKNPALILTSSGGYRLAC